jgi:ubiquinone/menaquinone biosynthesis C-methylase UbiE
MNEKTLQLLTDLHINNHRQGPGSDDTVRKALQLTGINSDQELQIADIGCGTGASSILLAQELPNAHITAVDFLDPFLEKLTSDAKDKNVADHITTIEADMADLPFSENQFDVIWSEGAIYNIGFKKGIELWKPFLKKNGIMVLTEITGLRTDTPQGLKDHWEQEYPEIDLASEKIKQLEQTGYELLGYFPLSEDCWTDSYYTPLKDGMNSFLERNNHEPEAQEIVETEHKEYELYLRYKEYISYGCYVVRKF